MPQGRSDATPSKWLVHFSCIVCVCIGAQLGALLRQILSRAFGGKCPGWGACVTSDGHDRPGGALYQDSVPNMLGCFIIGLLSTSDSFKLDEIPNSIAVLPQRSSWQPSSPVLLGLKTGFCGSLTSFSSWMLQITRMLIGGVGMRDQKNPVQAVFSVILGLQGILHSYQVGSFTARYCAMRHQAVSQAVSLAQAQRRARVPSHGDSVEQGYPDVSLVCTRCATTCRPKTVRESAGARQHLEGSEGCSHQQHQHVVQCAQEAKDGPHTISVVETDATAHVAKAATNLTDQHVSFEHSCNHARYPKGLKKHVQEGHAMSTLAFVGATLFLVVVSGTLVGLAVTGFVARKEEWPSVLLAGALAPVGALARWQMARWNSLPQRYRWKRFAWLPLGTLVANILACTTVAVVFSTSHRFVQDPTLFDICTAVITGVLGSLSTASTWAVEVEKLGQIQDNLHAFYYSAGSIILAQVLICSGYSWVVWA